jgi:hypothetical protein
MKKYMDDPNSTPVKKPIPLSMWFLVAANVVPIFGVILLGWNIQSILLLYWVESAIVGFFNIVKMVTAQGELIPRGLLANEHVQTAGNIISGVVQKLFLIPFFIIHYGGFMLVHGVFLFALFANPATTSIQSVIQIFQGISIGIVCLFISHGFSFFRNYVMNGEYKTAQPGMLMMQPYARIVVMHITIIIGGIVSMMFGQQVLILVILIVLKTGVDVVSHFAERKKFTIIANPTSTTLSQVQKERVLKMLGLNRPASFIEMVKTMKNIQENSIAITENKNTENKKTKAK